MGLKLRTAPLIQIKRKNTIKYFNHLHKASNILCSIPEMLGLPMYEWEQESMFRELCTNSHLKA